MLKLDLGATEGGVFDGLLGLVVEAVVIHAAMGRPQGNDASDPGGPRGARWRAASRE